MDTLFAATWSCGRNAVNKAWRHWTTNLRRVSPQHLLLDAVEQGIIAVEMDQRVNSVGLGGLPNSLGRVELDAAWMEGGELRAGGVAGLRDFLPAISIARRVMECTPHILLVGKGAEQFAVKQGFRRRQLLTNEASRRWREWKRKRVADKSGHDTVGVIGWHKGHVVVGCSTSGTAWKLPGRVGDSPILGDGLYADDQAGAAVATGLGEEILRFNLTGRVVDAMRQGASAKEACERAIRFMIRRQPNTSKVMVAVLAVRKDGQYAIAATKKGFSAYVRKGQRIIVLRS